jgi:maltose O-acetyltransferase
MNKWRLLASKIYRFFKPIDNVTKYRKMGATIGENVYIANNVTFDSSHTWLISIGNNVGIAPFTHILCHDGTTKEYLGYAKIGRVDIGNNVIIGADCTILPGVSIGSNTIIGTKSLVTKDIPDNVIAAGNPAKVVCSMDDYVAKQRNLFEKTLHFDESYTLQGGITEEKKNELRKALASNRICFVK